jgi:hypothetical protein
MLKEIESNKKLKHVECNDRSEPLLPQTKATEHFVFESEKANVHNELLKQVSVVGMSVRENCQMCFSLDSRRDSFEESQNKRQKQTGAGGFEEIQKTDDHRGADSKVGVHGQYASCKME